MKTIETQMDALRAQINELSDRINGLRQQLQKSRGLTLIETYSHPDVTILREEKMRLCRENATLVAVMIRENLARFQIEDMKVTAKVEIVKGYSFDVVVRTVEVGTDLLSNFCLPYSLWPKVEIDESKDENVRLAMPIFLDDHQIGYIDSDAQFNFTTASDLRTCVGWAVASDYGRVKLLDYDLDFEVNKLEHAIKMAPPVDGTCEDDLKKFFFEGTWKQAIQEVMEEEKRSRFGDGYCGVTAMFWRVATRTIRRREHPAFPFAY